MRADDSHKKSSEPNQINIALLVALTDNRMGGKRSSRRGKGGGGRGGGGRERGRGGNDAFNQQTEDASLVSDSRREPPARLSQQEHRNPSRGNQAATVKQPQEPPTDYFSENDHTEYRSNKSSGRAGSKPVTRAEQKRTAAATITRRQDPPDESQLITTSSHSSENRINKNNQDGRNRRKTNDYDETQSIAASSHSSKNRINKYNQDGRNRRRSNDHFNHQYHNSIQRDSPQLDEEEQLQYEQYEDQHYHQHFLHPIQKQNNSLEPDEMQEYSTSHRQFSLAPLNVEMTSYKSKASKERNAKKEERRLQQQQKAQRSQFSQGRYENVDSNQSDSDDVSDDYSYGYDDDDDDQSSYRGITRHEQFYNYDDDDSDDEDEERPLRRSRSSSRLQKNRRSPPPAIMTRCEKYQNRALMIAFAMVAFMFVRDHSPWWKKHKASVEYAKHHHHHEDGSDDDDNVRNVKLDPMSVYNSNDDDSTHTKDHDPTHKYIKEEEEDNKYNEHSAGERISSRPAMKSLNHGFKDESYENRPKAKNSASTAAKVAGVRMGDSKAEVNEEESAFLKSVQGKTKQYSTSANVGKSDQLVPAPPPIPDNFNTPSDATSISSEVRISVDDLAAAGINAKTKSGVAEQTSSISTEAVTQQQQQQYFQPQQLPPTESNEQQQSMPSETTSISSEVPQSVDGVFDQATAAGINVGIASGVEQASSSSPAVVIEQQQQQQQQFQPQQLPLPTETNDRLIEWGEQDQVAPLKPSQNIGNILPPNNDPIVSPQSPQSSTFESSSSSNTVFKPMANDAMSGSAFMSNSLKAQDAQEVKEVYKNSFYRWNHSFRHNADEGDGRDVPVFWRIPRSASSTVEDVMSNCYHLTMASALGTRQGHDQDQSLSVVTLGNSRFVNVDMSNPDGIGRAKAMNLGASSMADAISTPFLYETASIFEDVPDSGKCFTMLRHPVDRAVSLYFRYQSDDSNPNTAHYKGLSIDEYAEKSTESNWMVRFLTNKRSGALSWHDLESAKEVFGRKCLVGLVEEAEESIRRYERFFGWGGSINGANDLCASERFQKSDKRNQHESFEGTNAWEVLRKKNEYDVLLYDYAKHLYTQQATLYENFN